MSHKRDNPDEKGHVSISRREMLLLTATAGSAAFIPARAAPATPQTRTSADRDASSGLQVLSINGEDRRVVLDPMTTLADALRERVGLTGTKIGCNHGQCGACTVLVDGRRVLACLTLAITCAGKAVTTIEGLAKGDRLHPMQQAFIDHDAFQCGYCTPGQIMSAVAFVRERRLGSYEDIREYMSGNLCRCAAYPKIVMAVRDGAQRMEG